MNAIIGTLILKKSLDSRIKKSWTRFRLTSVISTSCTQPALTSLHFPTCQWQIVNDYISAIYGCFAAYTTATYRLGFKDGAIPANLPTLDAACLDTPTWCLMPLKIMLFQSHGSHRIDQNLLRQSPTS